MAPADFNDDGKPDILWWHRTAGYFSVWLLNGTTLTAAAALPTVADTNWQVVGIVDFNGDGKMDLLFQHQTLGYLSVWFLNGTTVTGTASLTPGQVADMNWRSSGSVTSTTTARPISSGGIALPATIRSGSSNGRPSPAPATSPRRGHQLAGGRSCRLQRRRQAGHPVPEQALGYLTVWFMNGTTFTGSASLTPGQVADTNWKIILR